jgi:hypothetical protein
MKKTPTPTPTESALPEPQYIPLNVVPFRHPQPMSEEEATALLTARFHQLLEREGGGESHVRIRIWHDTFEHLEWADDEPNPDFGKHLLLLDGLVDCESFDPLILGKRCKLFREIVEIYPPEKGDTTDEPGRV